MDGCRSKLANVLSVVPQDSVLATLLILLHTLELFTILENKLICYSDDSTLRAVLKKVYKLWRGRCKLNTKKTIVHDGVT